MDEQVDAAHGAHRLRTASGSVTSTCCAVRPPSRSRRLLSELLRGLWFDLYQIRRRNRASAVPGDRAADPARSSGYDCALSVHHQSRFSSVRDRARSPAPAAAARTRPRSTFHLALDDLVAVLPPTRPGRRPSRLMHSPWTIRCWCSARRSRHGSPGAAGGRSPNRGIGGPRPVAPPQVIRVPRTRRASDSDSTPAPAHRGRRSRSPLLQGSGDHVPDEVPAMAVQLHVRPARRRRASGAGQASAVERRAAEHDLVELVVVLVSSPPGPGPNWYRIGEDGQHRPMRSAMHDVVAKVAIQTSMLVYLVSVPDSDLRVAVSHCSSPRSPARSTAKPSTGSRPASRASVPTRARSRRPARAAREDGHRPAPDRPTETGEQAVDHVRTQVTRDPFVRVVRQYGRRLQVPVPGQDGEAQPS